MGKKVSKSKREEIYNDYIDGTCTQVEIADKYGVSQATVSNIAKKVEGSKNNNPKNVFIFKDCNVAICEGLPRNYAK